MGGFKNGIFLLNYDEREEQKSRDKEGKNKIRNENSLINYKNLERLINLKNRDTNDELVRKHFFVQDFGAFSEKIEKLKNNAKKNKIQTKLINSELRDLKKEIKGMSKQNIVEKIPDNQDKDLK